MLLKSHQKTKYLDMNLTKEVKNLYAENYKPLIKETEWFKEMERYLILFYLKN